MHTLKNQPLQLINNLTPSQFFAEYWQKKPLLIRQAIPNFTGLLSANDLAGLACEEDIQARIIKLNKDKWTVKNGPFDEADFAKLPASNWTLLVQSVNHYLPEAAALLSQFDFIPHARLDDLMVSYAPKNGGVGAHVDSYDVFLLQGSGRRNWKISSQKDLSLIEGAPLKILKNFICEQEWTLEAGDMLYLPPQIAHWGVSESDDCMTYSVGFRAPKTHELMHEFLSYLQDNLNQTDNTVYSDPDLQLHNHPAEISTTMVHKVNEMLQAITWNNDHVTDFLGKYLTEPKPDVIFEPSRKISQKQFANHCQQKIVMLDLKSQMLFSQNEYYLNGEKLNIEMELMPYMQELANKRYLNTALLTSQQQNLLSHCLYPSYLAGFIGFK